jgi:hypothetical protein
MELDSRISFSLRYNKKPIILIKWLKENIVDNKCIYDVNLQLWKEVCYLNHQEIYFKRYKFEDEFLILKEIINNNKGLALLNIRNNNILINLTSQEIICNDNQITMVKI